MTWLVDTLTFTGLLIVAVLILRRPVARFFGPRLAYALWALPMLRLLLPPVSLPASWAPHSDSAIAGETVLVVTGTPAPPPPSGWTLSGLADIAFAVWLAGVAGFIIWRIVSYARMRQSLLAEAQPVGEAGLVRLVESPAVIAPVAFGVTDKVIALPPGFMAWHDRKARDLALAHEFAHHAGHDLLINIAAQPLLALHWCNPFAWLGWRAMRRDQEAACDARVLAGQGGNVRADYARLIAGMAGGPRLALAAPMACPVLGEKSIIHRLRSLTMPEPTDTRRRIGIGLAGATLLALPLTATYGYAAADAPTAPSTPSAPDAPAAPPVPDRAHGEKRIVIIQHKRDDGKSGAMKTRTVTRDGKTITITTDEDISDAELDARIAAMDFAADTIAIEAPEPPAPPAPPADPANPARAEHRIVIRTLGGGHAMAAVDGTAGCAEGIDPVSVATETGEAGKRKIMRFKLCTRQHAMASALDGIRKARDEISHNNSMPADIRAQVVKELDEEIAKMAKGS